MRVTMHVTYASKITSEKPQVTPNFVILVNLVSVCGVGPL
jgi:hypothetical protein